MKKHFSKKKKKKKILKKAVITREKLRFLVKMSLFHKGKKKSFLKSCYFHKKISQIFIKWILREFSLSEKSYSSLAKDVTTLQVFFLRKKDFSREKSCYHGSFFNFSAKKLWFNDRTRHNFRWKKLQLYDQNCIFMNKTLQVFTMWHGGKSLSFCKRHVDIQLGSLL